MPNDSGSRIKNIINTAQIFYKNKGDIKATLKEAVIKKPTYYSYKRTPEWEQELRRLEEEENASKNIGSKQNNRSYEAIQTPNQIVLSGVAALTVVEAAEYFKAFMVASRRKLEAESVISAKLLKYIGNLLEEIIKDSVSDVSIDKKSRLLQQMNSIYLNMDKSVDKKIEILFEFHNMQKLFEENNLIQLNENESRNK